VTKFRAQLKSYAEKYGQVSMPQACPTLSTRVSFWDVSQNLTCLYAMQTSYTASTHAWTQVLASLPYAAALPRTSRTRLATSTASHSSTPRSLQSLIGCTPGCCGRPP
jgi:hypothetical protein